MSEGVRHDPTLGLLLDGVIADRIGRAHRLLNVAGVEVLLRVVGPDAGVEIRLKFETHGILVVIRPSTHRRNLVGGAEQFLHMVSDLVGDDISLGEIPGGVELPGQFVVKSEIDVDLLVRRTVKRPHRGAPRSTAGVDAAAVDRHRRQDIAPPQTGQLLGPDIFGIRQHHLDKVEAFLFLGRHVRRLGIGGRATFEEHPRIDDPQPPSHEGQPDHDENALQTEATSNQGQNRAGPADAAATTGDGLVAGILDSVTFSAAFPLHDC